MSPVQQHVSHPHPHHPHHRHHHHHHPHHVCVWLHLQRSCLISSSPSGKLLIGVVLASFLMVGVIFAMKCSFKIGFQLRVCKYFWVYNFLINTYLYTYIYVLTEYSLQNVVIFWSKAETVFWKKAESQWYNLWTKISCYPVLLIQALFSKYPKISRIILAPISPCTSRY